MDAGPVACFRFGNFVLNLERGCLQQDGVEVELRPKAFGLLCYLVGNAGRLISKTELVEAIWPKVFVSDDSLSQCVLEIRKSLGDHERNLIKTVPRRGYVFDCEVEVIALPAIPTASAEPRSAPRFLENAHRFRWKIALAGLGVAAASILALSINYPAAIPESGVPQGFNLLLKTSTTVVGQPISAYPAGAPVISAAIVPLAPGAASGWHTHPVPLFAYVLSGTIRVDYGTKGSREYHAGDALIEAQHWPHNAENPGTEPASILVVYVGAEGVVDSDVVAEAR